MLARIARGAALAAAALFVAGFGAWGTLFLHFTGPGPGALRGALAVAFAVLFGWALVALFVPRWRWRAAAACLLAAGALLAYWSSLEPRADREWAPEVAVLPRAEIAGDQVTVRNIRNFDYRSETDFTPAYYDKTFDLSKLDSVDIVASYWMGPAIAHVFLSFGFAGDDYLAISIEVRKPKGEGYSTLKGFFRQYELIYVVADERDVIRLRTNYRKDPPEDVYVYRTRGVVDDGRRLFLEYLQRINALHARPEFYNTLTTNCTTNIWTNAHVNPDRVPLSWKVLASGYVPEYLYEQGRLAADGLAFPELMRRAHVNARAQAADAAPDFSRRIRAWSPPEGGSATPAAPAPGR